MVTEIDESEVSDANFVIPSDYEIFDFHKDMLRWQEKLNAAAANKKTYEVGSKIPDVLWDF